MSTFEHSSHDELASAYLDRELDAGDTARVQGDAAIMGLVASFGGIRDALRIVEPADAARREQSIAAALAEFDALTATEPTPAGGLPTGADHAATVTGRNDNVVSIASRQKRYYKLLSAAAGVAIVGVIGASALRSASSDDSAAPDAADSSMEARIEAGGAENAPEDAFPDSLPATAPLFGDVPAIDSQEQLVAFIGASAEATVAGGSADPQTAATDTAEVGLEASIPPSETQSKSIELPLTCTDADGNVIDPKLDVVSYVGRVIYQGVESEIVQVASGSYLVVDFTTCDIVAEVLL